MENKILTVVYVAVILGFGFVSGILYSFAIIIVTMVGMVGVLEKGLVTGISYSFGIYNVGICFIMTGILHSFETDISKRCMNCICIGLRLVTYYIG